mmetsp:Transcript_11373/g.12925  ORF Transcript_11373/g.12925 Transcript_11373/m.12925 type:complete len:189 (+) Transcript_11373:54-620(+)
MNKLKMALNPPMYSRDLPMAMVGETYILSRDGIDCEVSVESLPQIKGSGKIYLTTKRLIFVCNKPVQEEGFRFVAFAFPLDSLRNEDFKQPIFGCNHLVGTVDPMQGTEIQHPVDFKLYFKNGTNRFLTFFMRALRDTRTPPAVVAQTLSAIAARGDLGLVAAADPNDPSVVYIAQPDFSNIPQATPL